MLRHYLTIAARNFVQHKLYSLINAAGLSVGLACAIFIVLFLRDELSYDRWIPDSGNLYRAEVTFNHPGRPPLKFGAVPFPIPQAMQEQIPEVRAMTRIAPEEMTVTIGGRQFPETVMVVDPDFFRVIKLPLLQGDPASVFAQHESLVLSQSTARKYFGAAEPLGKGVTLSATRCERGLKACKTELYPLTVTGVLRDLPHNTHLVAELLIPNTSRADEVPQAGKEEWQDVWGFGYVALAPGVNPDTVLTKLRPIIDRSVDPRKESLNLRGSDFEQIHLTPFRDVHLTSDNYGGLKQPGSRTTLYGFVVIAILILIAACFNFTNLATARATLRAREISLRKAMGATRSQLFVQFLGEALLIALLSMAIALGLVEMLLPFYDDFLQRPIRFHYLADWPLLLAILATAIAAGVLGGFYPALVMARLRPTALLKTGLSPRAASGLVRMALVICQFAVSICLGIATIVVFSQINFARTIDLGFERDGIVVVGSARTMQLGTRESFARALRANPGIAGVALSNTVPFDGRRNTGVVRIPGQPQTLTVNTTDISPEFPELYGMRLLAGRLLSTARGEDMFSGDETASNGGRNVLMNLSAAHLLGYSAETSVGKTIVLNDARVKVAGVLADAKVSGATESATPIVYFYRPDNNVVVSVRVRATRLSQTLPFIDGTWRAFAPDSGIQRYFLSDVFDNSLQTEEKQGAMFGLFVGVAIFIACLGLFGLAAFTAERRTREIGIRKVFGARVADILRLLLWQFSIPVLIANVIAWPISYHYLNRWLESYAYRISLSPLYFLTAGTITLAIACTTVLVHTLRAARASPIHALRHE
jgi:putative ABC transport system permease protein